MPWVIRNAMIEFLVMQLNSCVELSILGNLHSEGTIQSDYSETKSTLAIQGVFGYYYLDDTK
jgi:hypothetical protein